jgi:hypothetical protein
MVTVKTSKLIGLALDWAVAKYEYQNASPDEFFEFMHTPYIRDESTGNRIPFTPSTNWSQSGPIIEREHIATVYRAGKYWLAYTFDGAKFEGIGPTPLIAAMRCYIASKLGNEVEIPDELT